MQRTAPTSNGPRWQQRQQEYHQRQLSTIRTAWEDGHAAEVQPTSFLAQQGVVERLGLSPSKIYLGACCRMTGALSTGTNQGMLVYMLTSTPGMNPGGMMRDPLGTPLLGPKMGERDKAQGPQGMRGPDA